MADNELLIGVGGLVLAGLTYFAGIDHTKRQFSAGDKDHRINKVVDHYLKKLLNHCRQVVCTGLFRRALEI